MLSALLLTVLLASGFCLCPKSHNENAAFVALQQSDRISNDHISRDRSFSVGSEEREAKTPVEVTIEFESDFSCEHQIMSNEGQTTAHRLKLRNYFSVLNQTRINELGLSGFSYSWYSPFAQKKYESAEEFYTDDYSRLKEASPDILKNVFVDEPDEEDFSTVSSPGNDNYPFVQALADVGVYSARQFDGGGVKIGILENSLPTTSTNLSGIAYHEMGSDRSNSHCYYVSSVLGGNGGVASGAELYFGAKQDYSNIDIINWFISSGVNVINHSGSFGSVYQGCYRGSTAYIDNLVKETKVSFINASGNTDQVSEITTPGTGMNVITVGSSNRDKTVSSFTTRNLDSEYAPYLLKPTLTAPGANLYGISNVSDALSGTSFSAPIVTGISALLMQEFPDLKYKPEKLMALLTCSCTPAVGQTAPYDDDAGFGIVNYQRARSAYSNSSSSQIGFGAHDGDLLYSTSAGLQPGETILICSDVTFDYSLSFSYDDLIIPNNLLVSKTKLSIQPLPSGVSIEGSSKSNMSWLSYTNTGSLTVLLSWNLRLDGPKQQSVVEKVGICYSVSDTEFLADVFLISGNYLDETPVFSWDITQNQFNYSGAVVDFLVTNYRGQEIIKKTSLSVSGSLQLSASEWANVIALKNRDYYAYILYRSSNNLTAKWQYSTLFIGEEPADFNNKIQIKPEEWGFAPQYYFYEQQTVLHRDGMTIGTRRLRCGYIEEKFVNLSPRRQNAGIAFFELLFDRPVYSYMFGVTLWSSEESLYPPDCSAILEELPSSGVWMESSDLLTDITLSTQNQQVDRYAIRTLGGIYGLRFTVTSPAVGDRNKGRICLDDIVLNTDPNDLSFISTFYV